LLIWNVFPASGPVRNRIDPESGDVLTAFTLSSPACLTNELCYSEADLAVIAPVASSIIV
jgi:hypothetical protein